MSAIKLPVELYFDSMNDWWGVIDDKGIIISTGLQHEQTSQIVTALNMHDELVSTLRQIRQEYLLTMDGMDDAEKVAALLARAESSTETKP